MPKPAPRIANDDRAECAAHALDQYGLIKEGHADYDIPEDMAADLICDLLHLIRAHDYKDPLKALEIARMNFEAEEAEEKAAGRRLTSAKPARSKQSRRLSRLPNGG